MKIQQINRYRAKSGWQITGASREVTQVMEKEFTAMYTTVPTVTSDIPFILDAGYGKEKNDFYISHVIKGGMDTLGRPTPFFTGFIIDRQVLRYFTDNPEQFLRISSENFNYEYDAEQEKKKELPELESFQMDDLLLDVTAIRHKYAITDEEFEQLIYRIYEAFLDDSGKIMEFGFDGPKEEYVNLIREMVFLAYSVVPPSLRNRITFSSYQITGMINRMFTVMEADGCGQNTDIWFNLKTREFSELSGDKAEISLRTEHLSYLVHCTDQERKQFLEKVDDNLKEIYRNPSVKSGESLQIALLVAFLAEPEVCERCINPDNFGKYMGKLVYMKADKIELIEERLAVLLNYAKENELKIPDNYFKRCQNYYFSTQNEKYMEIFLNVISTREPSALKKSLKDAMKEQSSKRVDDFIAKLISGLSEDNYDVWTQDVVALLEERYLTTESSELKECYYEYIGQMNLSRLSEEALKKTIEKSISQVRASKESDTKERAIGVLKSQVKNLDRNEIELSKDTIKKLLKICVNSEVQYENSLFDTVRRYYQNIYLSKPVEDAVENYKELRDNNSQMGSKVEEELYKTEENKILDYYYVKYQLPDQIRDYNQLYLEDKKIQNFPVSDKSSKDLLKRYKSSLNSRMKRKKNDNSSLYDTYENLKQELEQLSKENEISSIYKKDYNEMLCSIESDFWKYADIEKMSRREFDKYKRKVPADSKEKDKMQEYWNILDEFKVRVISCQEAPDEKMVKALTTDQYIRTPEKRKSNLYEAIGSSREKRNSELSLDALLMRYFDQNGGFWNKGFLENLTPRQQAEIKGSLMLKAHNKNNKMSNDIKNGIKKQKRKSRPSPLKIIIPVLGVAFILTATIVAAKVFIFSGKDDIAKKSTERFEKGNATTESGDRLRKDTPESEAYMHWLSLNPLPAEDGQIKILEEQKIGDTGFCIQDGKIYTVHEDIIDNETIASKGTYSNIYTDEDRVYCINKLQDADTNKICSYRYDDTENELDSSNKKSWPKEQVGEISSFCMEGKDIIALIKGGINDGKIMRVDFSGEEPTSQEIGNLNDFLKEEAFKISHIINWDGNLYGILEDEKVAKKILTLENDTSEEKAPDGNSGNEDSEMQEISNLDGFRKNQSITEMKEGQEEENNENSKNNSSSTTENPTFNENDHPQH